MSFFGFDTTLPKDRPGFTTGHDAFAGLSGGGALEEDALDFEETLADKLDETFDELNADTFGDDEPISQQTLGRDFDFSGQTAKMAGTLQEEHLLFNARQPPQRKPSPPKPAKKPAKTGYESYKDPGHIPRLEADANLWGIPSKKPAADAQAQGQASTSTVGKKMMSLEEVEAMLRAQSKQQQPVQPVQTQHAHQQSLHPQQSMQQYPQQFQFPPPQQLPFDPAIIHQGGYSAPPQILQRPQQQQQQQQQAPSAPKQKTQPEPQPQFQQHPQILQRQKPHQQQQQQQQAQRHAQPPSQPQGPRVSPQPRQILQNPNRLSGHGQPAAQQNQQQSQLQQVPTGPSHGRGASYQGPIITNPQQILQLSEEDRAAFLMEEAKRAKRNHKIHLLSKDNGLMTPQDKNFITRIQLQQLVTATGGIDEHGPEAALAEDFYYQVFSQIRGAPRQNPNQPANQFAQTYLFQTGGRYGLAGRRHHRGGDNHMQRMEQQVQRAVEAAKAKPKNKQLVIEGSLGKISFSNSKTPKPLLNIKRPESILPNASKTKSTVADRKVTLRDLENVYTALMQMEDHERRLPPQLTPESDAAEVENHMEWRQKLEQLNQDLWLALKVHEPIIPNSPTPHPFIAMLAHQKGKRAIPRVFRHMDDKQRVTIVTMMVVHLDTLDVVRLPLQHIDSNAPVPASVREDIELFAQAVIPVLFAFVNDAPLNIVVGLLGLVLERATVPAIVRTKVGVSVLTMFLSRGELLKEAAGDAQQAGSPDWALWTQLYNRLFDAAEPALPFIFPGPVTEPDDVHVWQFLAAMGVGASPEQQQRLVLGVKERVMETVRVSRSLPGELAAERLGRVNLFMRAIGLDVELLD